MKFDSASSGCQGAPIRGALGHLALVCVLLLCVVSDGNAANETEPMQGSFVYRLPGAGGEIEERVSLPLQTEVEMKVSGWVNRVKVKQTFQNLSGQWLNGSYRFPLPNEAAVDGMRLLVGTRVVEGQVKERVEAKRVFEEAKKTGRRASLVEQERPNIFSTSVANLGPGELLVVEINYQELVAFDAGEFSLRFPMVVNPRYSPEDKDRPADDFQYQSITGDESWLDQFSAVGALLSRRAGRSSTASSVNIRVELDAGIGLDEIVSPYHDIDMTPLSNTSYRIQSESQLVADRDFVLRWRPVAGSEPTASVFTQRGQTYSTEESMSETGEKQANPDDYALIMLLPPSEHRNIDPIPRELILVIDTSGSMSGDAMEQAKAAMKFALAGLDSVDSFNVIEFNSHVTSLSSEPLVANSRNIIMANRFVDSLTADGGTEMAPALEMALTHRADTAGYPVSSGIKAETGSRLRQVLFMTDGAVANEAELFNLIKYRIGESRLFTLGIGSAPNSHFMQRAAEFGRGTFTYIGHSDEVKQKVQGLLHKIEQPQITDIKLRYSDGTVPDYWPARIPDLYSEEPLLVAIKMRHSVSPDKVIVSGMIAGRYWQELLSLDSAVSEAGLDLIWANKQIAALELSKDGANDSRVKQQIIALALKYHLASKHTSLIAVDVTPVKDSSIVSNNAAVIPATPFGWRPPEGTLPQTGTDSRLLVAMGLILLSLLIAYMLSFPANISRSLVQKMAGNRDAL
ncbi:marine proteobacterial sortase target protein [Shewanella atlantica]|uniref:marine proteobacterial sortase target protein n=1 Tax=Shewanella atlantica TaxID=271099 RepID=UPI003735266D